MGVGGTPRDLPRVRFFSASRMRNQAKAKMYKCILRVDTGPS